MEAWERVAVHDRRMIIPVRPMSADQILREEAGQQALVGECWPVGGGGGGGRRRFYAQRDFRGQFERLRHFHVDF